MKVMTAKVVDGKIDVGDVVLEEGASATVLISDESGFQLTQEQQMDLEQAVAEIDRGEFVDGRDLLRQLRRQG